MKKVITYGTYDLLHYGHIKLLERAKALGDYLIVGVTADDFDIARGKINVQQPLMERVEAVKATGLADEIIIEEYEGQKIDDIVRYNVDIFTVGSDWAGKFDYLNEYCSVVYLDRTQGVSSSSIRSGERRLQLGLVGDSDFLFKFFRECDAVNGVSISGIFSEQHSVADTFREKVHAAEDYDSLLADSDAIYVVAAPNMRYEYTMKALKSGKHVLCEAPIALSSAQAKELYQTAQENGLVLMSANKTAYSTAYYRLLLLLKSGVIGDIVSIDAACTSRREDTLAEKGDNQSAWNSICTWGSTAMLPVFQILGSDYISKTIVSKMKDSDSHYDLFSSVSFRYPNAIASVKVGKGIKSEGELIICGTEGYIYVPAPWWKTDYFEIRYENAAQNRRFFYQLEGEGIRYEIVAFLKSISSHKTPLHLSREVSVAISGVMDDFFNDRDLIRI